MGTIESINTTAELRIALDLHDVPTDKLHERFKEIADALLTKFAIQKGEQLFYISDIEFYYYTNEHKDFITYPRKCHAGEWFFHPSGVDIAFESHNVRFVLECDSNNKKKKKYKPILDSKAEFGGILIRSIKPSKNTKFEGDAERLINHPLNVSDFLFDHFDALATDDSYPILVECSHPATPQDPRRRDIKKIQDPENTNKDASEIEKIKAAKETERRKKFKSILNDNYSNASEKPKDLYDEFTNFLEKPLRYKLKEDKKSIQ